MMPITIEVNIWALIIMCLVGISGFTSTLAVLKSRVWEMRGLPEAFAKMDTKLCGMEKSINGMPKSVAKLETNMEWVIKQLAVITDHRNNEVSHEDKHRNT